MNRDRMKPLQAMFLIATCALAAACGGPATTQSAQYDVGVRIAGGNAIVFTDGGTGAVVGPVAPQPGSTADFNDHHMDLVVEEGNRDPSSSFAAVDGTYGGKPLWRAMGYDIELCEDGKCATTGSMTPPVNTAPASPCYEGNLTDGTMYYVPNLSELNPGSKLVADWRNRLETRLVLRRGQVVTTNAVECFEYKDAQGTAFRKDSIANGSNGVMNKFTSTAQFIDVVFSQNGAVVKKVRLTPKNKLIRLSLYPTGHAQGQPADDLKPGDAVKRFAPFYELLDPASLKGRVTLAFAPLDPTKPKSQKVNPGGECPPASMNAQ